MLPGELPVCLARGEPFAENAPVKPAPAATRPGSRRPAGRMFRPGCPCSLCPSVRRSTRAGLTRATVLAGQEATAMPREDHRGHHEQNERQRCHEVTARHCTASASPPSTWYAPTATSPTAPAAPTGTLPPRLAAPTANHYEQAGLTGGRQRRKPAPRARPRRPHIPRTRPRPAQRVAGDMTCKPVAEGRQRGPGHAELGRSLTGPQLALGLCPPSCPGAGPGCSCHRCAPTGPGIGLEHRGRHHVRCFGRG